MANFSLLAKIGVDSRAFQTGLNKADAGIKRFRKSALNALGSVASAFGSVFLVKTITGLGTAAAETASKFKAVFGPAVDEMNEKVQELRKTIPSTTEEMQSALATFAQMGKAFGFNAQAANLFSVEMVKLSGDIASFNNLPIEQVFTKIRAAISGEFEPLKRLGIVINESRLKQEALNLAIWDGTGQMSAAQKALAVQSILIRDMGDANGDAALTANSAANQIKFLQKSLKETGTEIGVTILPAVVTLTGALAKMLNVVKDAASAVGEFVGKQLFTDGLSMDEFDAKLQLESEGAFEKLKAQTKATAQFDPGAFKRRQMEMIKERANLIAAARKANKWADEEIAASKNEELKESEGLAATLEKQIALETDPDRKKALEDRLAAYQKLIEAAGKLESIQLSTKKPNETLETLKKKEVLELQKEINFMQMKLIRAQTRGDEEAEQSMKNRIKMAERIVQLIEKGFSRVEATRIANIERSMSKSSMLSGKDLSKAANRIGSEDGVRFQRMADGTFQQFVNGRKGRRFTEAELQAAVGKREGDKDTDYLKQIADNTRGKMVNE